jgi:hypothetical protein
MRLEDYTADAICRTMSLPAFIETHWTGSDVPTLRVVLTPSFHPELCMTFSRNDDSASLSVIALAERFWAQRSEVYLPRDREEVHLPLGTFEDAVTLFQLAHSAFDPDRRYVCCDGMGSESCLVSRAVTQRLHAHVSEQADTGRLVARLIDLAWTGCHLPRVRNALAKVARYLSVEYPLQDVPPAPRVTRLAVLGTAQERHEYFEMLRRHKKDEG